MLDISQSTYSKLESESLELNIKRLYQISEILDVNVYDILPPSKQSAIAVTNFFQKIWIRIALFLRKKRYQTTH
nr:helix-turn-helix transcriptional regulator [Pseudopedobacter sp.]